LLADPDAGSNLQEASMTTLRSSIVAAAIVASAAFTFSQTAAGPASGPDPSKPPVRCCTADVEWETGMPSRAGAPILQPARDEQPAPASATAKADFGVEGMFVDCCSCRPPCPCEITEVAPGCQGVGVHQISSGNYAGDDLGGVKIAHAKVVGEWVNLYIDARDEQRAAAEKFGRAAFAGFGPIKQVKAAKIEVSGADGKYTATVDGGSIMKLETEPLLGGDGKTPIGYTNIKNAVNPAVFQGKCVSATYADGDKQVTVETGRNSHFNPKLKSSGKI
jgi:hypothetical protein